MKKFIGYIISVVGLASLTVWTFPQARTFTETAIKFKLPGNDILLVAGIIITLVGVSLVLKRGRGGILNPPAFKDVPIYEGNRIVGYRRHK
ncbi:MAG: hypothetical protein AABX83_03000 [Nanoarchaeota archaeon]